MRSQKARLQVVQGASSGKVVSLGDKEVTIGRAPDNDIILNAEAVSRHHAKVTCAQMVYSITDLESHNGTRVNNKRLEPLKPCVLSRGDLIRIAGNAAVLQFDDPGATKTVSLDDALIGASLRIDADCREVWFGKQRLEPPLSPPQFRFLLYLYQNAGKLCTRDDIVPFVWRDAQSDAVSEQMIDALASRVRKRLRDLDPASEHLVTIRGHGFKFVAE